MKGGVFTIAKAKFVTAKLDWIKIRLWEQPEIIINELLGIEIMDCELSDGQLRFYDYDSYYSYGLIHVYTYRNALSTPDCCIQLSGQACTQLEIILESKSLTWAKFFQVAFRICEKVEFLRLDCALDDKNEVPYFTVEKLISKAKKNLYWSNGRDYSINESKYRLTTGKTLNIGCRTSDLMCRIYNKAIEQAKMTGNDISDFGSWNRIEIELKREPANDMVRKIAYENESLENLIRAVLRQELRFYTDSSKNTICRFWDKFLLKISPIKLNRKYEVTTLQSSANWLEEHGGLATYQAFVFLSENNALGNLNDLRFQKKDFSRGLSERMIAHLVSIGRTDLIPAVHARTKKEKEN